MKTGITSGKFTTSRSGPKLSGWVAVWLAILALAANMHAAVTVKTIAGGPVTFAGSFSGNADGFALGSSGPFAQFNGPHGLAIDGGGNLYVADRNNNVVRKITLPGSSDSVVLTVITNLNQPVAVALDVGANIYVLNYGSGRLSKFNNSGTFQSDITATLVNPTAMILDITNNVFYVTEEGGTVKSVTMSGTVTTLVAGGLVKPLGIANFDTNTLVVSDAGNHAIWQVNKQSGGLTLLAGSSSGQPGTGNGQATAARFNSPHQIATAPNGDVVVADRGNHQIRVVTAQGAVYTLYGVSSNLWPDAIYWNPNGESIFPGWEDGTTNAASREPVGVLVSKDGVVYVSEDYYHIIRQVTGGNLLPVTVEQGTNAPVVNPNTNLTQNLITLGFQSGPGSSAFLAAPGQNFLAPVTLTLMPNQTIFSMLFTLQVTNVPPTPNMGTPPMDFGSLLMKPNPDIPGTYVNITNKFVRWIDVIITNDSAGNVITNYDPVFTNGIFANPPRNELGVIWSEMPTKTNLYHTPSQDLITYSLVFYTLFTKASGSVVLGGYSFTIPPTAVPGDEYEVRVYNASAATGLNTSMSIYAPTNGSLTNGPINAIKRVRIVPPTDLKYLVGDVSDVRWFNAGDFGDGTLTAGDVQLTFQSAVYGINIPPAGSDLFDAMDSSDGSVNAATGNIDLVTSGDGVIAIDDVLVTLRRSLFSSYSNIWRYWNGGPTRTWVATTNNRPSAPGLAKASIKPGAKSGADTIVGSTAAFVASRIVTGPGTVSIPITLNIAGPMPLRNLNFRIILEPLDGAPVIGQPGLALSPQVLAAVGNPFSHGPTLNGRGYCVAWMDAQGYFDPSVAMPGLSAGSHTIGSLIVSVPAAISNRLNGAYLVHFDAGSALGSTNTTCFDGLITFRDRSSSFFGDSIPDWWRLLYFGTVSNILSQAQADADGDGISNLDEFRAGTNPNDIRSRLGVLLSKARTNSAPVTLRWPTAPGKHYVVEAASSLFNAPWTPVVTNIVGDGATCQYQDTAPGNTVRFYRVRVVE